MVLHARDRMGSYEILGPIGSGGSGEVYRAPDTGHGRDVAIKVSHEELSLAAQGDRLRCFEREARAAAATSEWRESATTSSRSFSTALPAGAVGAPPPSGAPFEVMDRLLDRLSTDAHRIEVQLSFDGLDGATERDLPGDAMCRVPTGQVIAVDVDGQVHGCAAFVESYQRFASPFLRRCVGSMRLGDFRDPGFAARLVEYPEAARRLGIFHDKERKRFSYGPCAACRFVKACSVCPASIGHIPGNADPERVPDFVCAFNRTALGWRALFPRSASWSG